MLTTMKAVFISALRRISEWKRLLIVVLTPLLLCPIPIVIETKVLHDLLIPLRSLKHCELQLYDLLYKMAEYARGQFVLHCYCGILGRTCP